MKPYTMRQPQLVALAVVLALCLGHLSGTAQGRGALTRNGPDDVVFISNTVPRDVDGNEVDAHGGCMLVLEDAYLWYGAAGTTPTSSTTTPTSSTSSTSSSSSSSSSSRLGSSSVALYLSRDLASWRYKAAVFSVAALPASIPGLDPPYSLARPKVLYNAAHRTYVLLVQLMGAPPNVTTTITQQDNSSSSSSRAAPSPPPAPPPVAPGPSLGAATSISPYGPFTWRGAFPAEELGYGDMDAAGDGDSGEGYLVRHVVYAPSRDQPTCTHTTNTSSSSSRGSCQQPSSDEAGTGSSSSRRRSGGGGGRPAGTGWLVVHRLAPDYLSPAGLCSSTAAAPAADPAAPGRHNPGWVAAGEAAAAAAAAPGGHQPCSRCHTSGALRHGGMTAGAAMAAGCQCQDEPRNSSSSSRVLQAFQQQQQEQQQQPGASGAGRWRGGSWGGSSPGLLRGSGAPVLFPYGGRWYLMASRDSGPDPSPLLLWVSSGPTPCHGPWVPLPSPTPSTNSADSQQHTRHQHLRQEQQQQQQQQQVVGAGSRDGGGGEGFPPELLSLPAFVHVHRFGDGSQLLVLYGDRWVAPPSRTPSTAGSGGGPSSEQPPSAASVLDKQLQHPQEQVKGGVRKVDPPGTAGKYVWLPLLQTNSSDPGLQLQPLSMWRLGDYRTPPAPSGSQGQHLLQQQ